MKLNKTQATVLAVVSALVIAAVVVIVLVLPKTRGKKAFARRMKAATRGAPSAAAAAAAASPRSSSRAGAPASRAAAGSFSAAAAAPRAGNADAHPNFLVNGSTANSEQPMPSPDGVLGMLSAASAGEGPQTDAKMAARAAMNLSDGKGIQFPPELLDRIQTAADLEAAIRSDPALAAQYAAIMDHVSQRADTSGISRAKPTREQAQEMSAVTSGLDVPHQGQFGGRSGAASAVSQERFASAVGESNLAQLAASRSQYDSLISKTLVAPDDHLRQAALVAMVHKVTDPGQRARLMSKVSSLGSAVFKDATSAEEGIRDGGTGYIGFTEQRSARGNTASLGARYSYGDGGDLAPIIFNYAPPSNVSREQIQACGFATHQAYEYASGRDAGLSRE